MPQSRQSSQASGESRPPDRRPSRHDATVRSTACGRPPGCIFAIRRIRRSADLTGGNRAIVRQVLRGVNLENDVIEKPLSADEALDRLREVGRIEAASIAALGRMWGWKRERTSKALIRWEGAGHIQRDEGPDGTVIIRVPGAVPADDPAVPAGTAPDDGPLPASDDVPAPGPDDVPAGSPDLPASDAVPPLMEEPAGITGIPAPDDDVPAGNPGNPAVTAPMVEKPAGVPAPLKQPEWRIVERPVWHPVWRPIVLS